jgi:hypothetical protein
MNLGFLGVCFVGFGDYFFADFCGLFFILAIYFLVIQLLPDDLEMLCS